VGSIEMINRNLMSRLAATDMLVANVARQPEKEAIIFRKKRHTYKQFNDRVNRLAHGLMELGLVKGDHAAIFSHNCDQFLIYWYALMKIGAIMVPVNWLYKGEELKYIINHSESKLFIVEDAFIEQVQDVKEDLKTVKNFGFINLSGSKTPADWFDIEDLQKEEYPTDEPEVEINGHDIGLIIYTSGTESAPKGAMLTHMALSISPAIFQYHFNYDKEMIFLMGLPCFHAASLYSFTAIIGLGGATVVMYLPAPEDILELTTKEKITHWTWVTTIYATLLQLPELENYDFSSIRGGTVFGSYVSPTMMRKWKELAPGIIFNTAYGQTECISITNNSGEEFEKHTDSVGRTMLYAQMQIQGPDGKKLPPGQEGEIVARSPVMMKGYFKDEEKTAAVFREGWLHTGDIGRVEEDGYLYFVDRIKDMIKTGGENVASTDVEEAILKHPDVAEVAVIGLYHPVWQEAVTAVITPLPGKIVTPEEIIDHCKKSIAAYKVPKKVIIQDDLPKSSVGKILKKDLKKTYAETFNKQI
jgi:fatty-acyl-CoA synthase